MISLALVGGLGGAGAHSPAVAADRAGSGDRRKFWGLIVQPTGAGNSVVVFGLAAALSATALLERQAARPDIAMPAAILVVCALLLFRADLHGAAALLGMLLLVVPGGRLRSAPPFASRASTHGRY